MATLLIPYDYTLMETSLDLTFFRKKEIYVLHTNQEFEDNIKMHEDIQGLGFEGEDENMNEIVKISEKLESIKLFKSKTFKAKEFFENVKFAYIHSSKVERAKILCLILFGKVFKKTSFKARQNQRNNVVTMVRNLSKLIVKINISNIDNPSKAYESIISQLTYGTISDNNNSILEFSKMILSFNENNEFYGFNINNIYSFAKNIQSSPFIDSKKFNNDNIFTEKTIVDYLFGEEEKVKKKIVQKKKTEDDDYDDDYDKYYDY